MKKKTQQRTIGGQATVLKPFSQTEARKAFGSDPDSDKLAYAMAQCPVPKIAKD